MITFHSSADYFITPADAIVNTVNCVGVMGKGLALEVKNRYPEAFDIYRDFCSAGKMVPGHLLAVRTSGIFVVNFPTKRHWCEPSRLDDIEIGLAALRSFIYTYAVGSISIPALGCSNGGLSWKDVWLLIQKYMDLPDKQILVFPPL